MHVSLLTPAGAALALLTLVPLAVLAASEARARRVRRELGLERPARHVPLLLALAVVLAGLLVGAAAAQPVLERGADIRERTDVNAYVVIDSTRSMLAADSPRSPMRMARARQVARELRASVPELKVGLASMTDRILPHLFPTLDREVFSAALEHSIGIEQPPPSRRRQNATVLQALEQLGPQGFYPATPERRILVVLSDFEASSFSPAKLGASLSRQRLEAIYVHVWGPDERIHGGLGDAEYRPVPQSEATLRKLAEATDGHAFAEDEVEAARAQLRRALGSGPGRTLWEERSRTELAPWLSLAALLPLGFVLYRRNI